MYLTKSLYWINRNPVWILLFKKTLLFCVCSLKKSYNNNKHASVSDRVRAYFQNDNHTRPYFECVSEKSENRIQKLVIGMTAISAEWSNAITSPDKYSLNWWPCWPTLTVTLIHSSVPFEWAHWRSVCCFRLTADKWIISRTFSSWIRNKFSSRRTISLRQAIFNSKWGRSVEPTLL